MSIDIYDEIFYFCQTCKYTRLQDVMDKYPEKIDIFNSDGIFFRLAVARKCEGTFGCLIRYFAKYFKDDTEKVQKLKELLIDIEKSYYIPQEMQDLLNVYITKECFQINSTPNYFELITESLPESTTPLFIYHIYHPGGYIQSFTSKTLNSADDLSHIQFLCGSGCANYSYTRIN